MWTMKQNQLKMTQTVTCLTLSPNLHHHPKRQKSIQKVKNQQLYKPPSQQLDKENSKINANAMAVAVQQNDAVDTIDVPLN